MKVLIVSSVGGHLTEIMQLAPLLEGHEVVLVVNDEVQLPEFPFARVYRITHAERDWKVLKNFPECARILAEERPELILSSGAGPAVPMALLGRLLLSTEVVYIECSAAVTRPSMTGRLLHPIAHHFYFQWSGLADFYPRGRLAPLLFR